MPVEDPVEVWLKIEDRARHRKERADNGFSWFDWINFEEYLSWVIIGGLEKFRDEGAGHPANLTEDEWRDILNEMIDGFQAHLTLETIHDQQIEVLEQKRDKALQLFAKYFTSLWD